MLDENRKIILSYSWFRSAQGLSVSSRVSYLFALRKRSRLRGHERCEDAQTLSVARSVTQEKELAA